MNKKNQGSSTQSVHLSKRIDKQTRSIIPPVVNNAAFAYNDLETWRQAALDKDTGHIYSRNTNPTTDYFEERIAALEGAEKATSFATGMAAISTTLFALLSSSDRLVSIKDSYGATYLHFTEILPRFNINCDICDTEDSKAITESINKGCDVLYFETPTNPTLKILDIAHLVNIAHNKGSIAIIDNTFATPFNQKPLEFGADIVIHSATKYLSGHGDVLGGITCGRREMIERIFRYKELTGPALDANSAFLLLRSLKTLGLRVERQNKNALELAAFLENHPKIDKVFYPGLESHPNYDIAKKQMSGFGGILSFELKGGYEAVTRFLPKLQYAYMAANLGQVETIAGPPSTTSHVELTAQERAAAGIPEGLVRYSVGIEDIKDLKADLTQALKSL